MIEAFNNVFTLGQLYTMYSMWYDVLSLCRFSQHGRVGASARGARMLIGQHQSNPKPRTRTRNKPLPSHEHL
jgi:hypothetical protein